MAYRRFDRSRLRLRPLGERVHDMGVAQILDLDAPAGFAHRHLPAIADRIAQARRDGRPVIWMMGAHVIRSGVSRFLIDLMARGLVTHFAGNGACAIHDYELSLVGATTESVAKYIRTGEFGLWEETGRLNEIATVAAREDLGFGEAVGRAILEAKPPYGDISVLAAAVRLGVPFTVHVSLGYDIVHEHPNCDGAAIGAATYTDFLIFTQAVSELEGGVLLNFGTAVMGPEVYLKALSMVRNVARQEGRTVSRFTTAVFDLLDLGEDLDEEAPRSDPRYYYRPFKTILVRTVRDGGESFYVQGAHAQTVPALYREVVARLPEAG